MYNYIGNISAPDKSGSLEKEKNDINDLQMELSNPNKRPKK